MWKISGNIQYFTGLQTEPWMVLKFWKIPETSAVEFFFTEKLDLLLKLFLPVVDQIAFANRFQLNQKTK